MAKTQESQALEIMRAAGYEPLEPFKGGDYPWLCRCQKCGKETSPRFRQVRDRGYRCKHCAGIVVDPDEAIRYIRAKGFMNLEPFPGASKKWSLECKKCGAIVSPKLSQMKNRDTGCIKCEAKKLGEKRRLVNSSESRIQVLTVMALARLRPLEEYKSSNSKWMCQCLRCERIVYPRYDKVRLGSLGCAHCSHQNTLGKRRLDHEIAQALMLTRQLMPIEKYPGAMSPWKCKCLSCGKLVSPRYASIQQGRGGCKSCGYKKNADRARMSQERAFKIALEAGFEPLEPYKSRHQPWKCRCLKCDRTVTPHLSRLAIGGGCKYCSRTVVIENDAIELMLAKNLKPLVKYPGAGKPWLSQCLKCKNKVSPRYATVSSRIGGCKYCANYGYNFASEGILYLITNSSLGAHKIGITNVGAKEKRLEKHLKMGWQIYSSLTFEDGNIAFEVEQEILDWLHFELGLSVYLSAFEMPQGGHTETVDSEEIDLVTIWKKVESVAQAKNSNPSKNQARKSTMPRKGSRFNP